MAGAGDAGQQSIGHATSGFDTLCAGTERGRYNTKGLYAGPKVVISSKQELNIEDEFEIDDKSVHYIGNTRTA